MGALQRLQEKIEQWRADFEAIKSENAQLKIELENVKTSKVAQGEEVEMLRMELEEKDAEIEKIIAQVETLLS